MPEVLGPSKNIWNFDPRSVPGCVLWLDGGDNSTMNSTTTVTTWNDKSGQGNTMSGTATWNGTTMTFNGSTQAFSNLTFTFPYASFSLFGVYSNTTAPAASAYMNAAYATGGYPMIGTYNVNKNVSARGVVGNTGALSSTSLGWLALITGSNAGQDVGQSIATDPSGNVFVTGYYGSQLTLSTAGGSDMRTILPYTGNQQANPFIAKYSPTGILLWATRNGSTTGGGSATACATDSSGNVFVAGYYNAAVTLYNYGGTTGATLPYTATGNNVFIAKYSTAGNVIWAARIIAVGGVSAAGVATDSSGNVFVTGSYGAALTLYNSGETQSNTLSSEGSQPSFIVKYSSDGSSVLWSARMSSTGSAPSSAIATDPSGNVFVAGSYYNANLTVYNYGGTTGAATLTWSGTTNTYDCFLVKYSSTGSVLWAAQITSTSNDRGYGVATDSSGNVFVIGTYGAALTLYNYGATQSKTLPFTASSSFLAKYSSDGLSVMWAARALNGNTLGVAIDSAGNVFVTGYYLSTALTLYNSDATQSKTLSAVGLASTFTAKYSSDGSSVLWAARIEPTQTGTYQVYINAIATDRSGNAFVTGQRNFSCWLYNADGTTAISMGTPLVGYDAFVVKYNSNGYITGGTPASSNVVVDTTYAGAFLSNYINGSNQTTLSATTVAATGFYVGGPSNYFNGSVSEILIYNSMLSSNQRSAVEGYLISKWGVKSSLPTTHPFYVTPAFNRTFSPTDVPTCALWLDAADNSTMNSTTTVTTWNDKSGLSNTMTGTATWTGSNMTFNGSTQAFSNTSVVFPYSNFSMFGVYSNTTAPAASAYMNVMYATGGYPMIGTYDVNKYVSMRGVVGNTGAVTAPTSASSNVLVDATYTGTTLSPYINGSNQTTITATTVAATGIYIGGPTNYFNGSISELLVYGSTLTAAQRQQVEGYLTQKWKLGSQVVSTHPYKTIPPSISLPAQYYEVTPGNWTRDWQPYLKSLIAANNPTDATVIPTISYGTVGPSLVAPLSVSGNYCGGVLAPNGIIYCMPASNTGTELMINTNGNGISYCCSTINQLGLQNYKGAVLAPNGYIYTIPSGTSNLLRTYPNPQSSGYFTATLTPALSTQFYQGGVLAPNGIIYCIPTGSSNILIINPITGLESCSYGTGGPSLTPALSTQFYRGGVLGPNGNIYCAPYLSSNILIINPNTNSVSYGTGGPSLTPALSTQMYWGAVLAPNGNIYCAPYLSSNILIINPNTNSVSYGTGGPSLTPALSTQSYQGGILAPNGNIYCIPVSSSNILIINPITNAVSYGTGGPSLSPALSTQSYFGGVLAPNGNIYCIPGPSTSNILIISNTYTQLPSSNYCLTTWNKY